MRAIVALLFLLPLLSPTVTAAPSALDTRGPDEDGAFVLAYALPSDATARLEVLHGGNHTTRELGLKQATSRLEITFLPAEGAGDYEVRLVAANETSDALRFAVAEGDGATRDVTFDVPDSPTTLDLTSDSVNADGKTKSPGEDLITRATLADANGVGGLRVRYRIDERDEGDVAFASTANATRASIELRFARFPIAAGTHRLTLACGNATATRTFVIREVPATLDNATLPPVLPDENQTRAFDLVANDKNGFDHPLEARIYRGASRLDLAAASTLAPEGARARLRVDVAIPARLAPGSYRVSIYDNATLAGSAPFDVLPLPTLRSANAVAEGDGVRVEVAGTGEGFVNDAPFHDGNATLHFPDVTTLDWSLALRARVDGPILETFHGSWSAATLALEPAGRNAWRVSAEGYDLSGASASIVVTRWDGRDVPNAASFDGATVRVAALEAGRYDARILLSLANGTSLRASWSFEAGPWLRLALGEAVVNGAEARIAVTNEGGVAIRRLVFEADNLTIVSLDAATSVRAFSVNLAPGQTAQLLVRLPDGPLAPGAHAGRVRAFAMAASA